MTPEFKSGDLLQLSSSCTHVVLVLSVDDLRVHRTMITKFDAIVSETKSVTRWHFQLVQHADPDT